MSLNNTTSWILLDDTNNLFRCYDIRMLQGKDMNSHVMIISILTLLLAPFTCLSNLLVLVTIWKNERLQTMSNILLANLSITDMFTGLITQPGYGIYYILITQGKPNFTLIIASSYAGSVFTFMSCLAVVCISTERYFSIFHPYVYIKWACKDPVIKLLIGLWVLLLVSNSIVFLIEFGFGIGVEKGRIIVPAFILMTMLWTSYVQIKIILVVRKIRRTVSSQFRRHDHHHNIFRHDTSNATKVSLAILTAMGICYTPISIVNLLEYYEFTQSASLHEPLCVALHWSLFVLYLNSFFNVAIYCYRMRDLRKSIVLTVVSLFRSQTFH